MKGRRLEQIFRKVIPNIIHDIETIIERRVLGFRRGMYKVVLVSQQCSFFGLFLIHLIALSFESIVDTRGSNERI